MALYMIISGQHYQKKPIQPETRVKIRCLQCNETVFCHPIKVREINKVNPKQRYQVCGSVCEDKWYNK